MALITFDEDRLKYIIPAAVWEARNVPSKTGLENALKVNSYYSRQTKWITEEGGIIVVDKPDEIILVDKQEKIILVDKQHQIIVVDKPDALNVGSF